MDVVGDILYNYFGSGGDWACRCRLGRVGLCGRGPKAGLEEGFKDRLMGHCRKFLSGPKRPRQIEIVEQLPRIPTGKELKRVLQEQIENRS